MQLHGKASILWWTSQKVIIKVVNNTYINIRTAVVGAATTIAG